MSKTRISYVMIILFRLLAVGLCLSAFVAGFNPAFLSERLPANASLFTIITSYGNTLGEGSNFVRAVTEEWITKGTLMQIYIGALITGLAVMAIAASACMNLGNNSLKRLGLKTAIFGSIAGIGGVSFLLMTAQSMLASEHTRHTQPLLPSGIFIYFGLFAMILMVSCALFFTLPKSETPQKYEMDTKYRLFLMILPFLVLVALFAYLPLWGWRFAFFDYRPDLSLTDENFVGLKWFRFLVENPARRSDLIRVLTNTFALSGIGIATAWLPMVFAIFLAEIKSNHPRKLVQTLTTIPNFISWVLVYSVAFAIFSTEGFLNWALINMGVMGEGANYLLDSSNIWLKMWLWGTWKGLGWSAIIYLAGISSIDQQLYEAAKADGAGRFKRMWHITVPGLMPTFFVLLLLAIANVLSNGLEQYLVFQNPANKQTIEVLDLYIYNYGIEKGGNQIPLATVVGMFKSLISVTLLFAANRASKWLRGETIV